MFAPCALEQVVTELNATASKREVIVEGANGPLTPGADDILEANGVLDPSRRARERGRRRRLVLRMGPGPAGVLLERGRGERAVERDRHARVRGNLVDPLQPQTSMRLAAYGLAVQRVAEATVTRGLYP